jgi:hypothetical protein
MGTGRLLPDEAEAFESTRSRIFPLCGSFNTGTGEPYGLKDEGAWPFWLEGAEPNLVVELVAMGDSTEMGETVLDSSEGVAIRGISFLNFFPDLESVTDEINSKKLVLPEKVIGGIAGATGGVCGVSTPNGGETESYRSFKGIRRACPPAPSSLARSLV